MSLIQDAWSAAVGRAHRADEAAPGTGGTAGNAALSAWTGLLLLVLFAAEGITVLSVNSMMTWHVVVGALIVPPLLLKIGSTGWRMISYYARRAAYVRSGPPPMLLRLLGPLVVITSVVLLGSGVVLILIGQSRSRDALLTFAGFRVDWIFIHQVSFFAWFAVMALHVIGRFVPALQIASDRMRRPRAVPGITSRLIAVAAAAALGVVLAFVLVSAEGSWQADLRHDFEGHHRAGANGQIGMITQVRAEGPAVRTLPR